MRDDYKDYGNYVAYLKEKLMNFDFGDCPPAQQLAEILLENWLGQEGRIDETVHNAIGVLQQWNLHASKVMEAEEND